MRCTLKTNKMPSYWHKSAAGCVAALLLGCATPPGQVGNLAALVPATTPVPGHGAVTTLAEDRAESKTPSSATPALAFSPSRAATAATSSHLQAEPVATSAPVAADAPWTQRGRASWYGKQFNGRRTASGERFNAMALTAAHRSLPLRSYARVRVVGSGKEVVVRINDRGPFHKGRVLDVSYAAARQLGIVARGTALVDIAPLAADAVPDQVDVGGGAQQDVP
jgi:rare lipoprotein A